MKGASKVFITIGLVCAIQVFFTGIILKHVVDIGPYYKILVWYGFYSIVTSILCYASIKSGSKGFVVVAGILYLPVVALASIFMFCIKDSDLY